MSVTTYSGGGVEAGPERTESKLTIGRAGRADQGNYTCSPSNAAPATVSIYVTTGTILNITLAYCTIVHILLALQPWQIMPSNKLYETKP